jgi:hypothetical protein
LERRGEALSVDGISGVGVTFWVLALAAFAGFFSAAVVTACDAVSGEERRFLSVATTWVFANGPAPFLGAAGEAAADAVFPRSEGSFSSGFFAAGRFAGAAGAAAGAGFSILPRAGGTTVGAVPAAPAARRGRRGAGSCRGDASPRRGAPWDGVGAAAVLARARGFVSATASAF